MNDFSCCQLSILLSVFIVFATWMGFLPPWEIRSSTFQDRHNISLVIVSTLRNPDDSIWTWIDHHLKYADHIMLYLDDPTERPFFGQLGKNESVSLWTGSQVAPCMTPESRILLHQDENVRHALSHSIDRGYTWLLHIDSDELYFEPDGPRLAWTRDEKAGLIRFVNHEAIPLDHDVVNRFESCEYFRVNSASTAHNFLAYTNGKGAVRIHHDVVPAGPHSFARFRGKQVTADDKDSMILHYSYPSFEQWRDKFSFYGSFPDNWFNSSDQPNTVAFMLQSRDIIQEATKSQNWTTAKQFFSRHILNPDELARGLAQDRIRRYTPLLNLVEKEER